MHMSTKRDRSIFPLPLSKSLRLESRGLSDPEQTVVSSLVDSTIFGLNALYGMATPSSRLNANSSQGTVHDNILNNCAALVRAIRSVHEVRDDVEALDHLTHGPQSAGSPPFKADAFDLLPESGKVDPLPCLRKDMQKTIREHIFENAPKGLDRFPGVKDADRSEYAKLGFNLVYV